MKIKVISVGKLKEEYLKKAVEYYGQLVRRYYILEELEVNDEKAPENYSQSQIEGVKKKEGEKILAYIGEKDYIIALDIKGKTFTTGEFQAKLSFISKQGYERIVFIIGGSNGLSPQVLKKANEKISFSPMTFPHQLMRIILLEQLGRNLVKND